MSRRLDTDKENPIGVASQLIKEFFLDPEQSFNKFGPNFSYIAFGSEAVTVRDNFDELQVPLNHVSREPSDNFYLSTEYVTGFATQKAEKHPYILRDVKDGIYTKDLIDKMDLELQHSFHTVLPTHTTSHLPHLLRRGIRRAIYSGQVFRRDAIDSKHYPVFHQLDGFMLFSREDLEMMRKSQSQNDDDLIMEHLKQTLEGLVNHLLSCVADSEKGLSSVRLGPIVGSPCGVVDNNALDNCGSKSVLSMPDDVMRHRNVSAPHSKGLMSWNSDTTFPFTDPSLELYLKLNDECIEVLGCGKLKNIIISNNFPKSDVGDTSHVTKISVGHDDIVGGWAFGIGLERLVMTLCGITDIRQFWELDERFLRQYRNSYRLGVLPIFKAYSRNPPVSRDVSFYVDDATDSKKMFNEPDFIDILETLCREYVEDVSHLSTYVHPTTGRKSLCYRVTYRAMGENLTNAFVNQLHQKALDRMVEAFNIELR
ncbi:putative phenylalanine-tRNA ligase [Babesia divergens]|uniref:phenylalanine--tRNA ligase n=1 Tax=Babesia divergens TaxID=32595 RepID=A0AAD9LI97_BABDI|nr:putative phenylalanine-tRNA ligase [Babesia divergens]